MTSLEWEEQVNEGYPMSNQCYNTMVYYKGCLYMTNGLCDSNSWILRLFKYCLGEKKWTEITNVNETEETRELPQGIIHNEYFYVFSGLRGGFFMYTIRVNLDSNDYLWSRVDSLRQISQQNFGLCKIKNTVYVFAGYSGAYNELFNELFEMNLLQGYDWTIQNNNISPQKRMKASMTVINGNLYLFGGKNQNQFYNNMWVFNVQSDNWDSKNLLGDVPSPRYSHAVDSEGDIFVLFGGEDALGLKNDIFIYNSLNSMWKQLIPKSATTPRATKGACIVLRFPLVYIYGGVTESGVSGELWEFNIVNLEFKKISESYFKRVYSKCYIFEDIFYSLEGDDIAELTSYGNLFYNFSSDKWTDLYFHDSATTYGIQMMLNKTYVRIGGHRSYKILSPETIVIGNNKSFCYIIDEYDYVYFSSYAYYKSNVYSFGGGSRQGGSLIPSLATSDFYSINLREICSSCGCKALCSKGTYKKDQECVECEKGYYSDIMGSNACTPCPPGTYNSKTGSSSYRQCYPCPLGTYNSKYGSSRCKDCLSSYNCPIGSKNPIKNHNAQSYNSVQPKMYSPSNNDYSFYYIISVTAFSTVTISIVLFFSKIRENLKTIDIYSDKHNYQNDIPMVLTKNNIGGFFTLIFIAITIGYIGSSLFNYMYYNIIESKALVPLMILDNKFLAEKIIIECILAGYGGECGVDGVCHSGIIIETNGLVGTSIDYKCDFIDGNDCAITIVCNDCEVIGKASIFIRSNEKISYSSAIYVNITSNSSIPNEISSIKNEIYASKEYMFCGSEPDEFYYTLTPSLFLSESFKWPYELTGYHVSSEQYPKKGTECKEVDLPISPDFKLMIYLYENVSGLLTQRLFKQSYFILISSLLGSVFGIMGSGAALMNFFETICLKIAKFKAKKKNFYSILSQRHTIQSLYFGKTTKGPKKVQEKRDKRIYPGNENEFTFLNKKI